MVSIIFKITQLTHDLEKKVSIVTIFWGDGSGKRLSLTVPFGTALNEIHEQAEAALKRHRDEIEFMAVEPTGLE